MSAHSTISLEHWLPEAVRAAAPRRRGRVRSVTGIQIEVEGIEAAIGDALTLRTCAGDLSAEVVALRPDACACMAFGDPSGVRIGDRVDTSDQASTIRVGPALLGRVLDGLGRPMDGSFLPPGLARRPCAPPVAPRANRHASFIGGAGPRHAGPVRARATARNLRRLRGREVQPPVDDRSWNRGGRVGDRAHRGTWARSSGVHRP